MSNTVMIQEQKQDALHPTSNGPIIRSHTTMDGNQAAAHVAYAYSEAAAIYPITPSSPMAELCDEWAAAGRNNIYGKTMLISQMQSEAGAAGAIHGALASGALATTFTSSQGLLLMIPNLYRMAGELLPGVIHVAARTIATHALSIFGDHSDIYACRQTGAAIFCSGSVQEVMDLSPVAHLAALEGRIPFIHFFDGFRTSHEIHKIQVWDYSTLKELTSPKHLAAFRRRALHPAHGRIFGSAQNPDIFFQNREASNPYYQALPGIVEKTLTHINKLLGTNYGLFDYYGATDAKHIIIAMGSVCEVIREYLDSVPDKKYGLIAVHLYRPFSASHLIAALPKTTKQITVLDRTKEPGAPGEPLYLDVVAALYQTHKDTQDSHLNGTSEGAPVGDASAAPKIMPKIFSGRYGLSSKDTTPSQIAAVYENTTKTPFTIGIIDDVTHLSLPIPQISETIPQDITSCKFWGLGGDGTISATKNAIKIIGDHTELNAQGYFEYDSKKSRGLTISHLRFGKSPIRSSYLIRQANFVACHNPVYLHKYQMAEELKDEGTFLVNFHYPDQDTPRSPSPVNAYSSGTHYVNATKMKALSAYLPAKLKAFLANHRIHLYVIDALAIGKEIGLNNKISTILQASFFAVSRLLEPAIAKEYMMLAAQKSYGKMGDKILLMNQEAIERGFSEVQAVEIPAEWAALQEDGISSKPLDNSPLPDRPETLDYVINIQQPSTNQQGDSIPVSTFLPYADGYTAPGTTAHERRNTATELPRWIPENCIQCNRCSFVCPHAVIRPAVLNQEQLQNAPENLTSLPMNGLPEHSFSIVISEVDCTGCGACAAICPGKKDEKALVMEPVPYSGSRQACFDYCKPLLPCHTATGKFHADTPKGSQFLRPLMEFSGACAGCGETPYVKLLTQLFGPRMYIANATGCSTIWANSTPSCAYTVDENGYGPAWSNSLFEDGAEFGYGMWMAQELARTRIENANEAATSEVQPLPHSADTIQWVIGGDGWAYDIGFSGLDHILASGKNINLLVLDTEVYSNTGGQASKATPLGSTAKFVSGGKKTAKKNLAAIAMTYENVYVAQIAMGADLTQTVKSITEAAAYPGPSLIIAYATCIAHGIRAGLGTTPHEEKKAVDAGYFHLFRFDPTLKAQGKNPFQLDSREPTLDYQEFLNGEIRYDSLKRYKPQEAEKLFEEAAIYAKEKYRYLKRLERFYEPDGN